MRAAFYAAGHLGTRDGVGPAVVGCGDRTPTDSEIPSIFRWLAWLGGGHRRGFAPVPQAGMGDYFLPQLDCPAADWIAPFCAPVIVPAATIALVAFATQLT